MPPLKDKWDILSISYFQRKASFYSRVWTKCGLHTITGSHKITQSVDYSCNSFYTDGMSLAKDYLTQKKPMSAMLIFLIPIVLGNLFQQLYTIVDSAVVGRFVGAAALAAIGASYALTTVFIMVANGGGIGASVIVSRYFGAKAYGRMKTAAFTAIFTFLGVSIMMGLLGLFFSRRLMLFFNTPAESLETALVYLNIYFMGLPFLFMYNVFSCLFNAMGKSKIPLYFLIFSSVLNMALDILFVTKFGWGVAGVAWATLIAQGLSAVLSFIVYLRQIRDLTSESFSLYDTKELKDMVHLAIPSIFQQSTVSIGMLFVQGVVNSFGADALAGYSATLRLEQIAVVPMNSIGTALSSYTAQNIGAGKLDRVRQGYRAAIILVAFFAIVDAAWMEIFHASLVRLFMSDANPSAVAFNTGDDYIRYIGWFFGIIGLKMATDGLLRGAGDTFMFTLANLVNLGLRVTLSVTLAPKYGIQLIWMVVPLGWLANFTVSFIGYASGKWKKAYSRF